jgi:hypothetical protein
MDGLSKSCMLSGEVVFLTFIIQGKFEDTILVPMESLEYTLPHHAEIWSGGHFLLTIL